MAHRRRPLVVFYVASNLSFAHQNRRKLLELLTSEDEQKEAAATADRLTLIANRRLRPTNDSLHLYTLTPATSVPMYRRRGGLGRLEERALIFRLLRGRFPSLSDNNSFAAICRGRSAKLSTWNRAVDRHESIQDVQELQDEFIRALTLDGRFGSSVNAKSILEAACREKRSSFIGGFRNALALAVLKDVHPDLIILDEFQKFRDLLIDGPGTVPDEVTAALRGGGRRGGPALLLLSATPYRLYSSRQDEAEGVSHQKEFLELIRFLFGADQRSPALIQGALREFGARMLSSETPDLGKLDDLRIRIQTLLRPVMSRTERADDAAARSHDREQHPTANLSSDDLRVFKNWTQRLLSGTERKGFTKNDLAAFAVPYWLSIPLPIQMMGRGYVAWRLAERHQRRRGEPLLRCAQRNRLATPLWPHPQFRSLLEIAKTTRLALPWVSPSFPWWEARGPWAEVGADEGKLLVFSRFKAVPPALASLLSYNLEAAFAGRLRNYERAGEVRPLQFKEDRPALPALFLPSPILIAFTDPRRGNVSTLRDVRNSMIRQVTGLLKELGVPIRRRGKRRPFWKLVVALEGHADGASRSDLPTWAELSAALRHGLRDQPEVMTGVNTQWNKVARAGLESISETEIATLAEFALSGPGVALGRALFRFDSGCLSPERYGHLLAASWHGLRPYLNRALFQAVLSRRGQPYTDAIREAVVSGNFESVLDEHLWITSKLDADSILRYARDLPSALSLRDGRHRVHEPGAGDDGFTLRCHAAMPFADAKVETGDSGEEGHLRTDDLRRSFNSPFWPHVLTTTSVGQEGLDFHVWCKQLLHWDLCSSPLDLEQREGRIQRFGGLSVRRAMAAQLKEAVSEAKPGASPWKTIASVAEGHFGDASGRSPWWSFPGETIDRFFVKLPNSRSIQRFDDLSRQRAAYRLALGQPHQQDFIETVSRLPNDGRLAYALNLSAWTHD
jgi:hypothetical protein